MSVQFSRIPSIVDLLRQPKAREWRNGVGPRVDPQYALTPYSGPEMPTIGPKEVGEWRKQQNRERLLRLHGARDVKEPI
jgi:hypothetical protein